MAGFIYLSGENIELARAEALAAMASLDLDHRNVEFRGRLAILDAEPPDNLVKRLGMCHFGGTVIVTSPPDKGPMMEAVSEAIEELPQGLSLAPLVRMPGGRGDLTADEIHHETERTILSKGRKLRLRNPDRTVFFHVSDEAFIGLVTRWSERGGLSSRRGSNLSFSRPVMMDPRISRSMVNLLAMPPGGRILDPFMGPGGLMMEAARLGYHCTGVELDPRVHEGAIRNMEGTGLSELLSPVLGDSRGICSLAPVTEHAPYDGMLTDPPFGRSASSAGDDPGALLRSVLGSARELIQEGGPVVLDVPDPDMVRDLEGFEPINMVRSRVHRSLTRHICVLRVQ
jgi:tRNA (guanine10-N2)-dimethyltransferase